MESGNFVISITPNIALVGCGKLLNRKKNKIQTKKTMRPSKSRCLSLNPARQTLPGIYRTTILKTKSMNIFIVVIIIIIIIVINIVQQS